MFYKDDIIGILAWVCLLIIVAFGLGWIFGSRNEHSNAVKAGVAHYVADENGNSKFEYKK